MTSEGPVKRLTMVFEGPAKGLEDVAYEALKVMRLYNATAYALAGGRIVLLEERHDKV